jgi:hypothetical protein
VVTEATASEGEGVLETLTEIVRLVMKELREQFSSGSPSLPEPSKRPAHEPDKAAASQESRPPAADTDQAASPDTTAEAADSGVAAEPESGSAVQEEEVQEIDLEPDSETVIELEADQTEEPEPDQEPFTPPEPGPSGVSIPGDAQAEMLDTGSEVPVKVLVPLEDLGTLELSINIRARVLEKGEMRSVSVDVSGAALEVPDPDSGYGEPEEELDELSAEAMADDLPEMQLESDPSPPLEPNAASVGRTIEAPVPELELNPEPESLAQQQIEAKQQGESDHLPPLGGSSDEPLGAPLDGQDQDVLDLPELPQEKEKILLDEDLKNVPKATPPPSRPGGYDPGVRPPDITFPETEPEDDEPKRRGLFGRRKKK